MECVFEYQHCSSNIITKIHESTQELNCPITIQFQLLTQEQYWHISSHDPAEYQLLDNYNQTHSKSLHLTIYPSVYMSHDMLYHVIQRDLENLFENNYQPTLIHDTMEKICKIIDDKSNNGLHQLEMFVHVTLNIDHVGYMRTLLEESSRDNGTIAASKSSMKLLKRMKVDEERTNDDCVICFQEFGKKRELLCMPCSHVFHGDCITNWLENYGSCCPICRCEMPTTELDS